jgi:hypothetical protein
MVSIRNEQTIIRRLEKKGIFPSENNRRLIKIYNSEYSNELKNLSKKKKKIFGF